VLQQLPGLSYLATSPVFFEMEEALKKTHKKKHLSQGMTRRKITSNIISTNIMNFNQPTVLQNFHDM
jgi:hypothetical protein